MPPLCEGMDAMFAATGEFSGHTLKHLVLALVPLLRRLSRGSGALL